MIYPFASFSFRTFPVIGLKLCEKLDFSLSLLSSMFSLVLVCLKGENLHWSICCEVTPNLIRYH